MHNSEIDKGTRRRPGFFTPLRSVQNDRSGGKQSSPPFVMLSRQAKHLGPRGVERHGDDGGLFTPLPLPQNDKEGVRMLGPPPFVISVPWVWSQGGQR